MNVPFTIRRATPDDIPTIARHRAEMFRDMGQLPPQLYDPLVTEAIRYLEAAVPRDEYAGWLATAAGDPARIVGGAGVHLRRVMPHPLTRSGENRLAFGRQGLVVNVYTEPEWRRRGVAELLMNHIIDWSRTAGLDTLVLHASNDGRHLYEKLGFAQTNEMRFNGAL